MTKKFKLELTANEALALVLLSKAGFGDGFVAEQVREISDALTRIDASLVRAQRVKWEDIGTPEFDLSGKKADWKTDWTASLVGNETVH
jgi:hypothetical protein